jgi:hypothetical protein
MKIIPHTPGKLCERFVEKFTVEDGFLKFEAEISGFANQLVRGQNVWCIDPDDFNIDKIYLNGKLCKRKGFSETYDKIFQESWDSYVQDNVEKQCTELLYTMQLSGKLQLKDYGKAPCIGFLLDLEWELEEEVKQMTPDEKHLSRIIDGMGNKDFTLPNNSWAIGEILKSKFKKIPNPKTIINWKGCQEIDRNRFSYNEVKNSIAYLQNSL